MEELLIKIHVYYFLILFSIQILNNYMSKHHLIEIVYIGDYSRTCVANMDNLGPTKCPDYQGVLIFQVSLCTKGYFGTSTKCVDYAGVLILKCPH